MASKGHPGLTETEIAYIAGLFDGEGCFDVHFDKRNASYYPRARIEMCNGASIQWLQSKIPGHPIQTVQRQNRNHSVTYRWCIQGPSVIEFSKTILPYLLSKKDEALAISSFPYPVKRPGFGNALNEEMKSARAAIKQLLHDCKTKGKGLLVWQLNI